MAGRGPGIAVPPGAAGGIQPNDKILVRIPHGSIPGLVLVRIPFWFVSRRGGIVPGDGRPSGCQLTCVISLVVMIPRCQRGGPGSIPG